ncbi:recombinase family protein [Mycetocola spongiae]|uniref:recombinase family protein n=1 Tax=Mycetocola spongiae TaxID=2859226 RepID=UPI001CF3E600|nr:recombinase family protein [Mycetocola spongiae]UCR89288.1 recombinase family protein [Mycetocola spongiae]
MTAQPIAHLRPARKAVLYLRQSTAREESISLELQESAGREYCARHGFEIVAVEADPGISGRTWNRPAVHRVMEMIEAKTADVIVLWKWSRLSRSRLDWAVAVDKVESAGGLIVSATEDVDVSTSTGRLARGMLAEFAAFESERIGDSWKEALHRRKMQGLPHLPYAVRFGYMRGDGPVQTPNPDTAPWMVACYEKYLSGWGLSRIARWLNENSVPTAKGAEWSFVTVKQVMRNGFAAGLLYTAATDTYTKGAHEALIDTDTWEAFLTKLRHTATTHPRHRNPVYSLSGLVICADCGSPMSVTAYNGPSRSFRCPMRQRNPAKYRHTVILREPLEAAVKEWVGELAAEVDRAAMQEAERARTKVSQIGHATALSKQLDTTSARIVKLTMGWTKGIVPDDAYAESMAQLEARRTDLATRLSAASRDAKDARTTAEVAKGLLAEWDKLDLAGLNAVLKKLIAGIVVTPGERAASTEFRIIPRWVD